MLKKWLFGEIESTKFKIIFSTIAKYTYITKDKGKTKLWNNCRYQMNIAVIFLLHIALWGNPVFDE